MMNDVEASLAIIFAVSEDRQLTGSLICAPALLRIFAAAVPIGEEPRPCDKVVSVDRWAIEWQSDSESKLTGIVNGGSFFSYQRFGATTATPC